MRLIGNSKPTKFRKQQTSMEIYFPRNTKILQHVDFCVHYGDLLEREPLQSLTTLLIFGAEDACRGHSKSKKTFRFENMTLSESIKHTF